MKMVIGLALLLFGGFLLYELISGHGTAIINAFRQQKEVATGAGKTGTL